MLKKLAVWGAVVTVAGLLAAPALAQPANADLTLTWGSTAWLANQFGGDPTFCQDIAKNPDNQKSWEAQFGSSIDTYCGWTPSQDASQPQAPQGSSTPQASQGSRPQASQGSSSQPQSSPSQTSQTSSG